MSAEAAPRAEAAAPTSAPARSTRGFVALTAATMAMVALGIDTLLPAFPAIREHLKLAETDTSVGLLVTVFMIGIGLGQPIIGPLSDRFGRIPILVGGLIVYIASAAAATFAPTLPLMVVARLVWGLAAAGPRAMAMAMIRDTFHGVRMAQILSYTMSVFMVVPILAPAVGAAALHVGGWRLTMFLPGAAATVLLVFALRSPETLRPEHRRAFDASAIRSGFSEVTRIRSTMAFALTGACITGAMSGYLSVSEQIIDKTYHHGPQFPLVFGAIAAVMAVTTFANARLVGHFGLPTMLRRVPVLAVAVTAAFAAVSVATSGRPPFAVFCIAMAGVLAMQTMIMPNANTSAMMPVGHLAGVAAGIIGSIVQVVGAAMGIGVALLHRSGTNVISIAFLLLFAGALALTRIGLGDKAPAGIVRTT